MSYTVSWRWNNRDYHETYPTLIQAMLRMWKLESVGASLHEVK